MASVQSTSDYTGRSVDIELLQTAVPRDGLQSLGITMVDGGVVSRAITGAQKMLQRYMLAIFTPAGEVWRDADFGTELVASVMSSGGRALGSIEQAFAFASADAVDQLVRDDADETTYGPALPDERIASVRILGVSIPWPGIVNARVRITSHAGEQFVFVVPVTAPKR